MPNPAAHADARDAPHFVLPSQSRAGGRERLGPSVLWLNRKFC